MLFKYFFILNQELFAENMSISLLKRELELELDTMDQKKLKTDKKDAKKKDAIKDAKKKKGTFKFNDKDYSKEDDHTLESLKSIGKLNI